MAELVYAEEYRRRLRRERASASTGIDEPTDDIIAARAAADTESAAVVEREREAARARRARSEEILSRAAHTAEVGEWTPIATRRETAAETIEAADTGVDFEPITRHNNAGVQVENGTVTSQADTTAVTGTPTDAASGATAAPATVTGTPTGAAAASGATTASAAVTGTSTGSAAASGATAASAAVTGTPTSGATGGASTAGAPTYRVVLDGNLTSHRIEIGGMQFTATDGVFEPVIKRKEPAVSGTATSADSRLGGTPAATEATSSAAGIATGGATTEGAVTVGTDATSVARAGTGVENTPPTTQAGVASAPSTTDIPMGHAAAPRRRGIIYADYGAMPGGATVPFSEQGNAAPRGDGSAAVIAPRDPLGLADKPQGAKARPENLDTPPSRAAAGGTSVPPISRDIDGDVDYVGPHDTVEPEYEYDGGIAGRGRATDIPEPRFTEEGDYDRVLADERRRPVGAAAPTTEGTGMDGMATHVPYDGRVVEEPEGVGRAPKIDPRAAEEEEYRRILAGYGGYAPRGGAAGGPTIDAPRVHVPYDGRVVEEPEGVGRAPVIDPTMLEEEDLLAFADMYADGRATVPPTEQPSGIDFVGVYEMPGEERGADIVHTYAPYIAPQIDNGTDALASLELAAATDRAAQRREMEADMTEFIRSTRRAECERREREARAKRGASPAEPKIGEASLIFDKKALTRLTKRWTERDNELVEARIGSRIAALEAESETLDMTFTSPDRAGRRDRRKLAYELKTEKKHLTRAKKFEKKDNARYYSLVMTDLAKVKLPEGADAERLLALRERAIDLLARRDELNERLAELYRGAKGEAANRIRAARERAARKGRTSEYRRQRRLDRKIHRMKVAYDYRKRLEELMDEQVRGMGVIKLYEHIQRREKLKGRAKREIGARLKEAIRKYRKYKKEIKRISKKAFRRAKDDKRRRRGEIAGWLALLFLAVIIGVGIWQWGAIWAFITTNVPILGEIFGSTGGTP